MGKLRVSQEKAKPIYTVVTGYTAGDLAKEVNDLLERGWHLIGQPFATGNKTIIDCRNGLTLGEIAQALMRERD